MKKLINILLILAAIVALVSTTDGFRRRLASEKTNKKALAATLEKNAALKTRISSLKTTGPAPNQASAKEFFRTLENAPPLRAKGPKGGWVGETPAYQQEMSKAFEEHKLNDREFGLKYYAALRSDVDTQYGPFYRLQHLTKEQTDALAEALFQRQLRFDQADADKQMGGSDADAQTARINATTELAAAVQEALGADLSEQFRIYECQRPAWDYVGNLGAMMSLVDMPLSLEQSARLAGAIADANPTFQNGAAVNLKMFSTEEDWNAVDAAAADFLTPAQLDFFKNTDVTGYGGVESRQGMELNAAIKKSPLQGAGFSKASE